MIILSELEEAIKNGPSFSQSIFQTSTFVLNKSEGSARTYRQVLIELNTRVTALKKAEISVKRVKAEINKLEQKLTTTQNADDIIIIQCDIDDKLVDLANLEKLVADSISECNFLYNMFKQLPKKTNEEYEQEEAAYWKNRLLLDAELSVLASGKIDTGTAAALVQIGVNPLQAQTEILLNQQDSMIQIAEQKKMLLDRLDKEQKNA